MITYDLLVKGGRVVDPGSGTSGDLDVAIYGGKIAAVGQSIPATHALEIVDARGLFVTPGLIDMHAHVADGITEHGAHPDIVGVLQGVTTVVDGGSTGSHNFLGLRRHVLKSARTSVLCFLHLCYSGEARMPEMRSRDEIDEEATADVLRHNRDVIRGVKIRLVGQMIESIGVEAVDIAQRLAATIDGSVMVHFGDIGGTTEAPQRLTPAVLDRLRPGDIISHPYTRWPGRIVGSDGKILPEARAAVARGVVLDLARGRMNFTIANARRALEADFLPTALSTDLGVVNMCGPTYGLADVASIFLNLGMSLEDVVLRVTANPARALGVFDRIGSLEPGKVADITLLDYRQEGQYEFQGFQSERLTGDKLLIPVLTIKDGQPPIHAKLPYGSAMYEAAREGRR